MEANKQFLKRNMFTEKLIKIVCSKLGEVSELTEVYLILFKNMMNGEIVF